MHDRQTFVAQVLSKLHIPVPPRRDVEIPLHLVPLQAAIDPTRIIPHAPRRPRRPAKRPLPPPHLPQHMAHMRILLLGLLPRGAIALIRGPMQRLALHPQRPGGRVPVEHFAGEDAVARGVLHVDVQVEAAHGDDDVEVDLQRVRDAFFHAEVVGFRAGVPVAEFGEGEEGGDEEEEEGGVAAGCGAAGVGRFGFGWWGEGGESAWGLIELRQEKGESHEKHQKSSAQSTSRLSLRMQPHRGHHGWRIRSCATSNHISRTVHFVRFFWRNREIHMESIGSIVMMAHWKDDRYGSAFIHENVRAVD